MVPFGILVSRQQGIREYLSSATDDITLQDAEKDQWDRDVLFC